MKSPKRVLIVFAALSLLYIIINLLIPEDADSLTRFGISASQAKLLKLSVLTPYIAIWFAAFWGYVRLKEYTLLVSDSKEGNSLSKIAAGLLILAIGLPISGLISTASSYIQKYQADLINAATLVANYVDIIIGVAAFMLIYKGAQQLVASARTKQTTIYEYAFIVSYALLGIFFVYFTLNNPYRQFPSAETGRAAYYLPDAVLIPTVIIPYLYVWFLGLGSAYAIQKYRHYAKGSIFRSALGYLASGLVFVVVCRIIIRYLSLFSTSLESSSLKTVLLILYVLLVLLAVGFILIAFGARKLKRIEEV